MIRTSKQVPKQFLDCTSCNFRIPRRFNHLTLIKNRVENACKY